DNAYNMALPEARRMDILSLKTATLFELPCRLGALLSGCNDADTRTLTTYGHDLGLAFQLTDDALDFSGDPAVTGKTLAVDLQQGVYSIPVTRTLLRKGPYGSELREILARARLTDDHASRATELVKVSGSIPEVLDLARKRARLAKRRLASLRMGA